VISTYLAEMGEFGKTKDKKAWRVVDQEFRTQKECRAWYEANRETVRQLVIDHLMANPEDV
jgi:hypothetical protein